MARPLDVGELLAGRKKNDSTRIHKIGRSTRKTALSSKLIKGKGNISRRLDSYSDDDNNNDNLFDSDGSGEYYKNLVILHSKNNNIREKNDDADDKALDKIDSSMAPYRKKTEVNKKFQFNWDLNEDTSSNYEPILSDIKSLLPKTSDKKNSSITKSKMLRNTFEQYYMGKHWTEKSYAEMDDKDWKNLYDQFQIIVKNSSVINNNNSDISKPLRNWDELKLIPNELVTIISNDLNFKVPTPIQRIAVPNSINYEKNKRDLIGVSSTGSGKTLAFVIPILIKLYNKPQRPISIKLMEGPKALILAPTRELAQQIQFETERITKLWKNGDICNVVSIVGGHSIEEIINNLKDGCDILVATPGRLIDCLDNSILSINSIETLVFDEADKMIDLGFEEQVKTILNYVSVETSIRAPIQRILFTATMSPQIELIANSYLNNPMYFVVGNSEDQVPKIKQIVEYCTNDEQKFSKLKDSILVKYPAPIIIFINYKATADWLAKKLQSNTNLKYTILHGSKNQEQREHSLKLLREKKAQVMIATNVAARGLDIPNVTLVVNFQMSKSFDDYVHRIGRTGRAGKFGTAITFVDDMEDKKIMNELYAYVKENNPTQENIFPSTVKEQYELGKDKLSHIFY